MYQNLNVTGHVMDSWGMFWGKMFKVRTLLLSLDFYKLINKPVSQEFQFIIKQPLNFTWENYEYFICVCSDLSGL